MAFTPFVKPGRSVLPHFGYDEAEIGRIDEHVCKVSENALCVSNTSSFPIVMTITLYVADPDGYYTPVMLVRDETVPVSGVYAHPSKLTLFAGDYLTAKALDQGQPDCTYTTALFWDELMMT